jgi:hypothetical protein
MIKVVIKVETDSDFILGFPKFTRGLRKIKYDQDYHIELEFPESTAVDNLLEFLKGLEIDSCKEWHKGILESGLVNYETVLRNEGLTSCPTDLLGGGNWSFSILVFRVTEELI